MRLPHRRRSGDSPCDILAVHFSWQDGERNHVRLARNGTAIHRKASDARRPVAVSFLDSPPKGVAAFPARSLRLQLLEARRRGPRLLYLAVGSFNCAVGSYTHNIPLSSEREKETEQTLGLMFQAGYIRPKKWREFPRLAKTPRRLSMRRSPRAPSSQAPFSCVQACKRHALHEAAIRAGGGGATPALGRPTCMGLPLALTGGTQISLGCIVIASTRAWVKTKCM